MGTVGSKTLSTTLQDSKVILNLLYTMKSRYHSSVTLTDNAAASGISRIANSSSNNSKSIVFGLIYMVSINRLSRADRSPACRSVMMALDAMNISLTEVDVDIDKAEHKLPEIAAMNPLKTLPILKDKEFILYNSHAINSYLASRYDVSDKILPQDPAGRALVDQLLHYDSGILQTCYYTSVYPILYENCRYVMPQQIEDTERAYKDLEIMLSGRMWFSGSWLTLGDIAVAATVSTLNVLVPIDKQRFPLLSSWLYRMSEEAFFTTANNKGLREFSNRIDTGKIPEVKEFKKCPRSSLTRRSTRGTLSEI